MHSVQGIPLVILIDPSLIMEQSEVRVHLLQGRVMMASRMRDRHDLRLEFYTT